LDFTATFAKSFASIEHFDERFEIFAQNYKHIQLHNSDLSAPFEMKVNQFSDLTETEFLQMTSGSSRPQTLRSSRLTPINPSSSDDGNSDQDFESSVSADIPSYKNWYEESFVSQPREQGTCGSCWAFTAASTLESLAAIRGFDPEVQEYSI
jgi:cathepsin F